MAVEPLKPKKGGFLRPLGCGWFIRAFLMGHGPNGSPKIDAFVKLHHTEKSEDKMINRLLFKWPPSCSSFCSNSVHILSKSQFKSLFTSFKCRPTEV